MRRLSLLALAARELAWVEEDLPHPAESQILVETIAGAASVDSE